LLNCNSGPNDQWRLRHDDRGTADLGPRIVPPDPGQHSLVDVAKRKDPDFPGAPEPQLPLVLVERRYPVHGPGNAISSPGLAGVGHY